MDVHLHRVSLEQKAILENLVEYYVYDFSEFINAELGADGKFGFYSLDHYWEDPVHHHAFFVKVAGRLAGFVLVETGHPTIEPINAIAEFFIAKKYRRRGIGKWAAKHLFDMFKGHWQITQLQNNDPAQVFWRHVVAEYTNGNYKEIFRDERFKQSFESHKNGD